LGRRSVASGIGDEQVREHGGFADLGVPGGGEQSQRLVPRQLAQVLQRFGPIGIVEFCPVAARELSEPVGIVAILFAQCRRRRDLLAPLV